MSIRSLLLYRTLPGKIEKNRESVQQARQTYSDSSFQVIHRDNYLDFITD